MSEIKVGDQVWPASGSGVLLFPKLFPPRTALAVYEHPKMGRWLWLVDDDGCVGSFAADYWTTEEPTAEERAACTERAAEIERQILPVLEPADMTAKQIKELQNSLEHLARTDIADN